MSLLILLTALLSHFLIAEGVAETGKMGDLPKPKHQQKSPPPSVYKRPMNGPGLITPDQVSFTYAGQDYLKTVDLRRQFKTHIPLQRGGFCHVFSATALFEAACYRVLKKKGIDNPYLDLSESYGIYRHLREQVSKAEPIDLSALNKTFPTGEFIHNVDGGFSLDSIKRFKAGEVCTEEDFSYDEKFLYTLQRFIGDQYFIKVKRDLGVDRSFIDPETKEWRKKVLKSYQEADLGRVLCETLEDNMVCTVKNAVNHPEKGVLLKIKDPRLKDCLESIQTPELYLPKNEADFLKHAYDLLSRGIPFLCETNVRYGPNAEAGFHALVVMGYTHETSSPSSQFLFRDSNMREPWSAKFDHAYCERMIILRVSGEKK